MAQRGFSVEDVALMLTAVVDARPSGPSGRWLLICVLGDRPWQLVVQPDATGHTLVVVTAWPRPRRIP
jgi:hypothetical protein